MNTTGRAGWFFRRASYTSNPANRPSRDASVMYDGMAQWIRDTEAADMILGNEPLPADDAEYYLPTNG